MVSFSEPVIGDVKYPPGLSTHVGSRAVGGERVKKDHIARLGGIGDKFHILGIRLGQWFPQLPDQPSLVLSRDQFQTTVLVSVVVGSIVTIAVIYRLA